ncbi:hypothetical protein B0T26DRAFT_186900 [Lasiosphaeria miniovina]|uniref:Uncharacterized protein n=1 Tax=Lasiosphaeria miniovina TaxID=1954250 RepID=A0AA40B741_9PEZI|nr:uncharacterized protein B0T26DRAFT_186900 [Lasiosphaeria miniovina]KAK0728880.1 hypothetical protein B0T26DRAFT_186900 [Lasiosphaeria miniovina]
MMPGTDRTIKALSTETCGCPRLLVLFIKLEKSKESAFNQKVSISLEQAETIFSQFDIHGGFMGDLIGRPDYWSAINRCKSEGDKVDDVFEFFCQHPRWAQSSRYEKGLPHALQGHRAPCSVYMHHSKARNLTLYMIAASEAEDWFPSLRQRIGINTDSPDRIPQQVSTALALSPFMIHAIMSVIAFEQSIDYVASVRDKLMTQIKHVNDYSTDKGPHNTKLRRSEMEGRIRLENITKELHLVSQTADSGIAGSHMSIKIAEKMLEAHSMHIMPTTTKEPRQQESPAAAAAFIRDTHGMLQYVRDSFYSQKDWLTSYKARKDTAMNFVFNMVTQQDSATNVDISYKMSNDSSSMNAVTILTLIFLPGTFLSVSNNHPS